VTASCLSHTLCVLGITSRSTTLLLVLVLDEFRFPGQLDTLGLVLDRDLDPGPGASPCPPVVLGQSPGAHRSAISPPSWPVTPPSKVLFARSLRHTRASGPPVPCAAYLADQSQVLSAVSLLSPLLTMPPQAQQPPQRGLISRFFFLGLPLILTILTKRSPLFTHTMAPTQVWADHPIDLVATPQFQSRKVFQTWNSQVP